MTVEQNRRPHRDVSDHFTPRSWSTPDLEGLRLVLRRLKTTRIVLIGGTHSADAIQLPALVRRCLVDFQLEVLDHVGAGSPTSAVMQCRRLIRKYRPDAVVAIGGGSVIDTAKAASVLASISREIEEEDIAAYWRRLPIDLPARQVPLVVVPTTAGTGTEATPFAVLSDAADQKLVGVDAQFQPDHAVFVPQFLSSVPRATIADLAVDAISHAIEAYWSAKASAQSDCLAVSSLLLLKQHLKPYYDDPTNERAARGVQVGATLAGDAFRLASSTACHALSFPMATQFHLSHGYACSLLLPEVICFNLSSADTRLKLHSLALALGLGDADELPRFIRSWFTEIEITNRNLAPATSSDILHITDNSVLHMMADNPTFVSREDAEHIVRQAISAA